MNIDLDAIMVGHGRTLRNSIDAYITLKTGQITAERDALRADAERYRWLRIQDWNYGPLACVARPKDAIKLGHDCPSRDRLDAAIDAARAQEVAK